MLDMQEKIKGVLYAEELFAKKLALKVIDKPSLSVFINDSVPFGAPVESGGSPEVAQSRRWDFVELMVRYYIEELLVLLARAVGFCLRVYRRWL